MESKIIEICQADISRQSTGGGRHQISTAKQYNVNCRGIETIETYATMDTKPQRIVSMPGQRTR